MRTDWNQAGDAAVVVAIGRWNHDALAEAYRRHGGAVYGLIRRVVQDAATAEDVTQEIFLRLWSDPERFDPERGSLRSWLLAQAHSRAIDRLRSDTARHRRETRQGERHIDVSYDVEREAWDLAIADRIQEVLGELPLSERKAIELAYFDGHTYQEVARMLETPEGTVKSRIRSGLKRLRAGLIDNETGRPWHHI